MMAGANLIGVDLGFERQAARGFGRLPAMSCLALAILRG